MQFLGCIAKLIAFGCAILFIVTALLALLFFNIDQHFMSSGTYKRALAQEQVYARLPSLVAELVTSLGNYNPCVENPELERCKLDTPSPPTDHLLYPVYNAPSPELKSCLSRALGENTYATLASGKRQATRAEIEPTKFCMRQFGVPASMISGKGGPPLYFWMLDASDIEAILAALFPADLIRTKTENFLDQLFDYLDSQSDSIKISWVDLKTQLNGDAGMTVLVRILRAQPPCTKEQLTRLTNINPGVEVEKLLACRPPEEIITQVAPQIHAVARGSIVKIPDQAVLPLPTRDESMNSSNKADGLEGVIKMVPLIRLVLRTSPLVPLVLLLMIALFGVRSLKGLMLWWGVPFLLIGLVGGGFVFIAWLAMDWGMATIAPADKMTAMGFTANLVETGISVARDVARSLNLWIGGEAGMIGLLGFVFLLGHCLSGENKFSESFRQARSQQNRAA